MKLKIINPVWCGDEGFDEKELEAFCAKADVVDVSEHFFVFENKPRWSLLIHYRDGEAKRKKAPRKESPRKALDPEERKIYDRLLEWRSMKSHQEGVPPYVVFTNRHLAEIALRKPETKAALREIEGIGPSKVDSLRSVIGFWGQAQSRSLRRDLFLSQKGV